MRTARRYTSMTSTADYQRRVAHAADRAGHRVLTDRRPVHARVNHGRLIGVCPNCGAGIPVDPEWDGAGCMDDAAECFRWFPTVVIPGNLAEIDQVLRERPHMENRNWEPGETVALLRAENDVRLHAPQDILDNLEGRGRGR